MEPEPGWYQDPWRLAAWRWWDGAAWTAHVTNGGGYPAGGSLAGGSWATAGRAGLAGPRLGADFEAAEANEARLMPWARASVVAYGVGSVAQYLAALGTMPRLRTWYHQVLPVLRQGGPQSANRIQTIDANLLNGYGAVTSIAALLLLVVAVCFLIWQFDAAKVARGLGYPARRSPGLGVGAWFIPVVNLWFPFEALQDCLPPNHPMRHLGLWAWLAYLGGGLIGGIAAFMSIFAVPAAIVLLVVSAGCWAVATTLGWRLVTAITEDHRQAASQHRAAHPTV
jgi:hypothetical protein